MDWYEKSLIRMKLDQLKDKFKWLERFSNPGPDKSHNINHCNTRINTMTCCGNLVSCCDFYVPDLAMKIIYDYNKTRFKEEIEELENMLKNNES